MVGLTDDLTFYVNNKQYPTGVRIKTDKPLFVFADVCRRTQQVSILEPPLQGKWKYFLHLSRGRRT